MEQEVLLVVATLQDLKYMSFKADICVYMDNHHFTYNVPFTQCAICLHLLIEDFYPIFQYIYIKGVDNVVPVALSCQSIEASIEVDSIHHDVDHDHNSKVYSIVLDNETLPDCFLHQSHLPAEIVFPIDCPILCF